MANDLQKGPFAGFAVQDRLKRGELADVYLAKHPELGDVALKVLHEKVVEDEILLHRFWREMRLSEKLEHVGILPVLASGVTGNRCWLAMPLVQGRTLREMLDGAWGGRLAWKEAVRIMQMVLAALEHAHENEVVHRNLKPENILIDGEGNAYVTEFGLAKHFNSSVVLTRAGTKMGTPYYMAPEQVKGAQDVGHQSDIYAVGVMLYEAVTGQVPFYAPDPIDLCAKHVKAPPQAPSELARIPAELELVILKAMEKVPPFRFRDAASMRTALNVVVRGNKTGIEIEMPVKRTRRGFAGWMMILSLILLVAVGVYAVRPQIVGEIRGLVMELLGNR